MVSRFADQLLESIDGEQFYRDARLEPASRPGEIRPRDIERVQAQVQAALDQAAGDHWFGELVTEPRYAALPDDDDLAEARAELRDGCNVVELAASAKIAWQQEASGIIVYANGDSQVFTEEVLPAVIELCDSWKLEGDALAGALQAPAATELLDYLLQSGCIYVE